MHSASPKITFRTAQRGDCALILRFIRELAEYERMTNSVAATEKLLEEWLFDKKAAEAMFAAVNGSDAAFAVFFPNFSTFLGHAGMYLEDLYVLPEYRSCGVGTALLRELARIAVERGYGRLEWQCLDWNEAAIRFYRTLGAKPLNDWTGYRLEGDILSGFANR